MLKCTVCCISMVITFPGIQLYDLPAFIIYIRHGIRLQISNIIDE
jgi:hypothetical protein